MLKKSKNKSQKKNKMTKKMRNSKKSRKVKGGTIHEKNTISKNTVRKTKTVGKNNDFIIIKPINKIKEWFKIADKQYNSMNEVINVYRNKLIKDTKLSNTEQEWVDNNLHILMDFMGNKLLWEYLIMKTIGEDGKRTSDRKVPVNNINTAVFSGAHWTSRKANDSVWFDPYKEYQINGSNQFCQTYAMMYLLDKLPEKIVDKEKQFTKYYEYTQHALDFIKYIIDTYIDNFYEYAIDKKIKELISNDMNDDDNIEKKQEIIDDHIREKKDTNDALVECMKYPNICLNSIIV